MSKVDTVKDLYGAFGQGDVPTVLAAMSPDIEWREAEGNPYQPNGAAWIGGDAIVESGTATRSTPRSSTTTARRWSSRAATRERSSRPGCRPICSTATSSRSKTTSSRPSQQFTDTAGLQKAIGQ